MTRSQRGRVGAKWEPVFRKDRLMNTARDNLLRFLCASALIVLGAAALNFVVDPLQLGRRVCFPLCIRRTVACRTPV